MLSQTKQEPPITLAPTRRLVPFSLLAEVDFKWLMAGQGWWINMTRFHRDLPYASALIRFALASTSFALRESAAFMQPQIDAPTWCDSEDLATQEMLCGSPVVEDCQRMRT